MYKGNPQVRGIDEYPAVTAGMYKGPSCGWLATAVVTGLFIALVRPCSRSLGCGKGAAWPNFTSIIRR